MKTIYLSILPSDRGISFSASLPSVDFDTEKLEVDYYNTPVVVTKNRENKLLSIDLIEMLPKHLQDYVLKHSNMIKTKNHYMIPLYRGWPTVGSGNLEMKDSTNNPFISSFYNRNNIVAIFDKELKLMGMIKNSDPIFEELNTGFYLNDPQFAAKNDKLFIGQGRTGKIYKYKQNNSSDFELMDEVQIFNPINDSEKLILEAYRDSLLEQKPDIIGTDYFEIVSNYFSEKLFKMEVFDSYLITLVKREKSSEILIKIIDTNDFKILGEDIVPMSDSKLGDIIHFAISPEKTINNQLRLNTYSVFEDSGNIYIGKNILDMNF